MIVMYFTRSYRSKKVFFFCNYVTVLVEIFFTLEKEQKLPLLLQCGFGLLTLETSFDSHLRHF